MRKSTLFTLLSLLITGYSHAQVGWLWQHPVPQGNVLYGVYAVNENKAIAVGNLGTILITTNSGANWVVQPSGTYHTLIGVVFVNSATGYIAGNSNPGFGGGGNLILKTTNAGNNWNIVPTQLNCAITSVFFLNANTGWLTCPLSSIFKTTNGGINWFSQSVVNLPKKVFFIDSSNGWGMGDTLGQVFFTRTTNGGSNWSVYNTGFTAQARSIYFHDHDTGWGTDNLGGVYKTINGGSNWSRNSTGENHSLHSIRFSNGITGWIAGDNSKIYKSTNGGLNWFGQPNNNYIYPLYSIHFLDTNLIYSVGLSGTILKTTNSGIQWTGNTDNKDTLLSVDFADINTGYISGSNGKILKSSNGGINWNSQVSGTDKNLNSVWVLNSDTAWIAGNDGTLLRTISGGNNWNTFPSGTVNHLNSIYFINSATGWISGNYILLKTTNGGSNWLSLPTLNDSVNSVHFTDQDSGWMAANSKIYSTVDGGANWTLKENDPYRVFRAVYFKNHNTGWVVGYNKNAGVLSNNGAIFRTTNSGGSWTYHLYSRYLWSLSSASPSSHVWSCGEFSIIKNDNNLNWYNTNTISTNRLYSINFVNDSVGWAVGSGGTILKTTTSGLAFFSQTGEIVPSEFLLSQNYPNPFNPTTKIKFDVPKASFTKLIVYDLLGREVTTLVSEELKPGTYQADWDASSFSSGVYFYKIISGDYVETKKMVLMK